MIARDILSIQMAYHFGFDAKVLLKERVNAALNEGEWHDDFDIAVTGEELTDEQTDRLLGAVLKAYPACVLDLDGLRRIIDAHLPQAAGTQLEWLVGPDCALILTDSLRVAKIASHTLVWVTKRISWDGIILRRIEDDVIFGSWYDATNSGNEWQPLRLAYATGRIIEGQEINF